MPQQTRLGIRDRMDGQSENTKMCKKNVTECCYNGEENLCEN